VSAQSDTAPAGQLSCRALLCRVSRAQVAQPLASASPFRRWNALDCLHQNFEAGRREIRRVCSCAQKRQSLVGWAFNCLAAVDRLPSLRTSQHALRMADACVFVPHSADWQIGTGACGDGCSTGHRHAPVPEEQDARCCSALSWKFGPPRMHALKWQRSWHAEEKDGLALHASSSFIAIVSSQCFHRNCQGPRCTTCCVEHKFSCRLCCRHGRRGN